MKEEFLYNKLNKRIQDNAYRELRLLPGKIDFCSNDYLGIVTNRLLDNQISDSWKESDHGSKGSRLLAGNYKFIVDTEKFISNFHQAEDGLIYNSGYDANVGLLSCIAQKGDTIIYDYLCHASIRDGIRLSFAKSWSFRHNDLLDLEKKIQQANGNVFVVTESVFSMDGDISPLLPIAELCTKHGAHLIVDEAHATGIIGGKGEGLVQQLALQSVCFARVHTFGKAIGSHGAIVLCSELLRNFLINFSRPLIYSTALPESTIIAVRSAYTLMPELTAERKQLQLLIEKFKVSVLPFEKLASETAIQGVVIPGNEDVKKIAERLQQANLDVRAILYPTVPKGSERLRIVLHAFNTHTELQQLLELLAK
jgi:8-amino-7-oxononanoate synthase